MQFLSLTKHQLFTEIKEYNLFQDLNEEEFDNHFEIFKYEGENTETDICSICIGLISTPEIFPKTSLAVEKKIKCCPI